MDIKGIAAPVVTIVLVVVLLIGTYFVLPKFSPKDRVKLETNMGDIVIELYSDMPITAGNFQKLVGEGFYDGVLFHRVINGFVIQGGDPLTKDPSMGAMWGTGGPGYMIEDEFPESYGHSNKLGTISMANAGPDTGGSQFFINLKDNILLDDKHPVFGEVVEGMEVVDEIANVQTDDGDRPVEDVRIIGASVLK